MRENATSLCTVACSLILALSCSDHDSRLPPGSDSTAGAAAGIAGEGGTTKAEGGAAGSSQGGAGDDGDEQMTTSGGAGSQGGEAGARFTPGGEGGAGATAGSGVAGAAGADTGGEAGVASATGHAGAPPTNATHEQRELCESICAKEPLTNGFAGAPTAPCPHNENCVETFCGLADSVSMPTPSCVERFTELLTCWDSLPDEAYECHSIGLLPPYGCVEEDNLWYVTCT